jgi:FemAB-related protein (PEP-CTERM system-associated)
LQNPSSSIFHLTAWKRLIEQIFGFEPRYLLAEDSGRIRGVLPLFLVSNPIIGRTLISSPFGVYGGVCASDEEARSILLHAACAMARQDKVQYLELREQRATAYPGFRTKTLYVTFQQEFPRTPEELLRGFPRDTRYMIRKAEKCGLSAVTDNQQLDIFYEIYAHSVRQLGTPVFGKDFFKRLHAEFGDSCEITVVWHGAKAVAGALSFRFRDWILPYYGGSLMEGRALAANNFLYWEVMKRALQRGLRHFDFGRSKIGTGAYAFKTQWSMREYTLPYQYYLVRRKEMPNFSPANPRFKSAITIWRHLPLSLTKLLGPRLVRLFP